MHEVRGRTVVECVGGSSRVAEECVVRASQDGGAGELVVCAAPGVSYLEIIFCGGGAEYDGRRDGGN